MTENAIIQISAGVISLLGTIFSGVIAYFMVRLKVQAEHARAATDEVAKNLAMTQVKAEVTQTETNKSITDLITIASSTHMLVNSASLVQLRLNALMARRIAGLTNDSGDIQAAVLAENLYERHKARLVSVDKVDAKKVGDANVEAVIASHAGKTCSMKDCKFRSGIAPECAVEDCPFHDYMKATNEVKSVEPLSPL
jgi:hypothetical protein